MNEREMERLDKAFEALAKATDIKIQIERYFHKNPEFDATGILPNDNEDKIPLAIKFAAMPTNAKI